MYLSIFVRGMHGVEWLGSTPISDYGWKLLDGSYGLVDFIDDKFCHKSEDERFDMVSSIESKLISILSLSELFCEASFELYGFQWSGFVVTDLGQAR